MFDFSFFKKHPTILIGVGLVGAYVFYELALAGGSSGAVAVAPATDPSANATQAALTGQAASIQAQASSDQLSVQYNLQSQSMLDAYNEWKAQLDSATSLTSQTNAITGQLALGQLSLQGNEDNNTTQITLASNAEASSEAINKQNADLQTAITNIGASTSLAYANIVSQASLGEAGINASLVTQLAGIQADVTKTQLNDQTNIATAAVNAQKSSGSGLFSFLGGVVGSLL